MAGIERVRKLKWLCRRGMKELDILLERFVIENETLLAQGAWPELEAMLETEDDILWDWFQNPGASASGLFEDLLKKISHGPG